MTCKSEAEDKGSNGGRASASKTLGRLQEGVKTLERGRSRKKERNNIDNWGALVTEEPSGNPEWTAEIADLYPRIVEIALPLSKRVIKKIRDNS